MNKVMLAGRLASDPELIITKKGSTLCRVSVACNDAMGMNDDVYFFNCTAWENRAKFIGTYLKKGTPVVIDGRLQKKSFINNEGNTIYTHEIIIDNIKSFGGSKNINFKNQNNEIISDFKEQIKKENLKEKKEPAFQDNESNPENINDFDLDWLDDIED
ncbi:MAG: single-stranded DNA-binding protein [Mycoplasmoidaceae bacterium]